MHLAQFFLPTLMAAPCAHGFVHGASSAAFVSRSNTPVHMTLRSWDRAVGTALLGGALLLTGAVGTADVARADILYSPRCITGEGAQCDDLAEGNELIKSLQAKSALSKERYLQESLDTYNEHNFKDYFRAENKHMVKRRAGKYEILTNAEYDAAEKAGKVKNDVFLGED